MDLRADFLGEAALTGAGVAALATEARRAETMERRLLAVAGAAATAKTLMVLAGVGDFFLADLAAERRGLTFFTLLGVCCWCGGVWWWVDECMCV